MVLIYPKLATQSLLVARYCALGTQEAQSLALQEFKLRLEGSTEISQTRQLRRGDGRQGPAPQYRNISGIPSQVGSKSVRPWGQGQEHTQRHPSLEFNFKRGPAINLTSY